MNRKELEDMLRNLDFSDYEAKTYSAMIFLGHSKASEISRISRVPQPKVYEVLDKLIERKLVEVYAVRPKEFRAVSPEITLRNLIEEKEKKLSEIKEKIDSLPTALKFPVADTEFLEGVWTSREMGWKDFIDRLCDMFNRAKKYAYVMSRDFSWSSKLGESVKSCIKRGIQIRTIAIGDVDETNFYRAKWFSDHGVKIKVFKTSVHPRIIDMDGKEILIRLDTSPTQKERFVFTSIWSKDVSLAKVIDSYVKNIWKISKPVDFDRIPKLN